MEYSSPKRSFAQMTDSEMQLEIPATNIRNLQDGNPKPGHGSESPRTTVARRLESLDLRQHPYFDANNSPSPRKRTKLRDSVLDNDQELADAIHSKITTARQHPNSHLRDRSSSPSPLSARTSGTNPETVNTTRASNVRLRSPPPPRVSHDGDLGEPDSVPAEDQDAGSLTWHLSEITGMSIDLPAGDDGRGINGIGFRPSPQIAHLRKQRRNQQLNDYRMREAREARQKRFERRQGCRLATSAGSDHSARSVRFAEML